LFERHSKAMKEAEVFQDNITHAASEAVKNMTIPANVAPDRLYSNLACWFKQLDQLAPAVGRMRKGPGVAPLVDAKRGELFDSLRATHQSIRAKLNDHRSKSQWEEVFKALVQEGHALDSTGLLQQIPGWNEPPFLQELNMHVHEAVDQRAQTDAIQRDLKAAHRVLVNGLSTTKDERLRQAADSVRQAAADIQAALKIQRDRVRGLIHGASPSYAEVKAVHEELGSQAKELVEVIREEHNDALKTLELELRRLLNRNAHDRMEALTTSVRATVSRAHTLERLLNLFSPARVDGTDAKVETPPVTLQSIIDDTMTTATKILEGFTTDLVSTDGCEAQVIRAVISSMRCRSCALPHQQGLRRSSSALSEVVRRRCATACRDAGHARDSA
jgi:hypothetical protein